MTAPDPAALIAEAQKLLKQRLEAWDVANRYEGRSSGQIAQAKASLDWIHSALVLYCEQFICHPHRDAGRAGAERAGATSGGAGIIGRDGDQNSPQGRA